MDLSNYLKDKAKSFKSYFTAFCRWLVLSIAVGALCGVVGAFFGKSVSFVTELRAGHGWLLFLLPLGGIVSVTLYKLCRVTDIGTNQVFESVRAEKPVSFLLAPAVFIGSVITHLFGGSAGREGAALQLGGSVSSLLGKIFQLDKQAQHILTLCGMGALFSALFGTPLGACVFALEVVNVGYICSAAFFPAIVSSITAYAVALLLGTEPERFVLLALPDFNVSTTLRVAVIAVIGAAVSVFFCTVMHLSHKLIKRYIKNPYIRIIAGSVFIILLTVILRTTDYNGSGMEVIKRLFEGGTARPEAFLLKIIFTAVTIAVGFKGGEIIPTLFIGANLGFTTAALIGLDPVLGAAVGMAALFCGVTNCPLATILLFAELFEGKAIIFIALSAGISFFLSGYASLYSGQKIVFSKFNEDVIDKFPE